MKLFAITLLLSMPLVSICQRVEITAEKGIDYEPYKTFRVIKGELVTVAEQPLDTTTFHAAMQDALVKELSDKGYTRVDDSTAHLVVSYMAQAIIKTGFQDVGPLGQQPVDDPAQVDASRVQTTETREGSVIIDITDRMNKKVLWRASSIPDINTITVPRVISSIVSKSLRKFPKRK